jgi:lysophospholipase L1-like esterase
VDLYARWKVDTLKYSPDVISILIGVNDTWHEKQGNGVEIDRYDQVYRMLLDWTRKVLPDVKLILMEPFVLTFGAVDETWLPEINQRREIVRKIAEDYNAVFVPLQNEFTEAAKLAPADHWMRDGVHPTPAGHRLIQKEWLKAAADLLK